MAAATGKAKAIPAERPSVGIFTHEMLSNFKGDGMNPKVTFSNFFDVADAATRLAAKEQEPYSLDGGLGAETFFESRVNQKSIRVPPRFNDKVPRKSSYRKLNLLATYAARRSFASVEALYAYAKKENDVTFQVPVKTRKGTINEFVGPETFSRYVDILVNLGVLEKDLRPSIRGQELIDSNGANFNEVLWKLLQDYWQNFNFTVSDVLEAIGHRVTIGQEPTARAIRWYLFQKNLNKITPEMMRITLDLAGYVNAIPYCSEKTFYPLRPSPN